jgi:hypothetical protein
MTWLDDLTLDTVIVHTTNDGPSIKGLAAVVHDDCIVLREAIVLGEAALEILNGNVVIPRERVLFMQVVTHDDA